MKKRHKVLLTLLAGCLWLFMLSCWLVDRETPQPKVERVILKDTIPKNWLIEPRFIDN